MHSIINSDFGKVNDLKTGDVIDLKIKKQTVSGPVIILPGSK